MMHRWMLAAGLLVLAAGCSAMHAMAVDPVDRARGIEAKIAEAERLGARSCAPKELARIKVSLDHLKHEAQEGYYPAAWLAPDFAAADKAVGELVEERRIAASLGGRFRCMSRSVEDTSSNTGWKPPDG